MDNERQSDERQNQIGRDRQPQSGCARGQGEHQGPYGADLVDPTPGERRAAVGNDYAQRFQSYLKKRQALVVSA
ncbi:hypothetical protein N5D61_20990 [Pseudomonas sp. GD03842]|uniref:hypothetical protein n=1 Tax=unclassified Pseudomonas TaxID=196821 RepID=UPI000D391CD8|nr:MULTISPECIES: hypothetical protein [unclassified Pseudomonas]MDH0748806.1 hypothetical protein [Pseudomonas sp. GD03842]RAU44040.1 hypothetical protein DBP26_017640 [Pseudomonas sp. RIT 409]RAU54785.1 hypothetical protein DBY65_006570 [Pseudomonas sp. RIT 412]